MNATRRILALLLMLAPAAIVTAGDDVPADIALLLRKPRPHVVPPHWRDGIHGDHPATYHLTRRAQFLAGNRHFDLDDLPPTWAPLYYAENWEDADNFRPYVYVDVSDEMDDWHQAFECFAIGRCEGDFPYWDWYEARTRLNGIAIRSQHAQAFAVDEARMRQTRELL